MTDNHFQSIEVSQANHVLVVFNKNAGSCQPADLDKVKSLFSEYGVHAKMMTLQEFTAAQTTQLVKNYTTVVMMGGDGTLSAIVNKLKNQPVTFGIIPAGTLNHFAKDLGLPLDLESCVKVIINGKSSKVDVGEVNGNIFLNNSSIGLYPKTVRRRKLYSSLGKWLAMTIALLKTLKRFPIYKVTFYFNDQECHVVTPLVFISNNEYKLELLNLTQRTKLTDGQLYLYINDSNTRLEFFKLVLSLILHKKKKILGKFHISKTQHCLLEVDKKNLDVAVDGEVMHLTNPLQYRIHKQYLTVKLPKESDL